MENVGSLNDRTILAGSLRTLVTFKTFPLGGKTFVTLRIFSQKTLKHVDDMCLSMMFQEAKVTLMDTTAVPRITIAPLG